MAKTKEELTEIGKNTQFTSENQPPKAPNIITQCLREYGDSHELTFEITRIDNKGTHHNKASLATNGVQTVFQAVAARLLQMALAGDIKAIKEILNRTEGRVPQPIKIGTDDGSPITFFELPIKQ